MGLKNHNARPAPRENYGGPPALVGYCLGTDGAATYPLAGVFVEVSCRDSRGEVTVWTGFSGEDGYYAVALAWPGHPFPWRVNAVYAKAGFTADRREWLGYSGQDLRHDAILPARK